MSEEDFWKKFFSSHYLHRDKNITDTKDLFTDCGKQDEQSRVLFHVQFFFFIVTTIALSVLKQDLTVGIKDPLLDLTALNDIAEEEPSSTPANTKVSNMAHQNMIKRLTLNAIKIVSPMVQHVLKMYI